MPGQKNQNQLKSEAMAFIWAKKNWHPILLAIILRTQ
jgi:hypothetical protein